MMPSIQMPERRLRGRCAQGDIDSKCQSRASDSCLSSSTVSRGSQEGSASSNDRHSVILTGSKGAGSKVQKCSLGWGKAREEEAIPLSREGVHEWSTS